MKLEDLIDYKILFLTMCILIAYRYITLDENIIIEKNKLNVINLNTSIFILPGYNFKMCDQLITNFHYPKSTLILLIAAFIGEDWKKLYKFAIKNNYRFLSYGDSSLLFKK